MLKNIITIILLFASPVAFASSALVTNYGANVADLDGDGVSDLIIKAQRHDLVGRSVDEYIFLAADNSTKTYKIAAFDWPHSKIADGHFITARNNDYMTRTLRLVNDGRGVEIIVGEGPLGDNEFDRNVVTFYHYRLKMNAKDYPYLALTSKNSTKSVYHDVNDAFKELGL